MKTVRSFLSSHWRLISALTLGLVLTGGLLLYRLGSLTNGLSSGEVVVANSPLGWHGLSAHPLYLPLKLVRSTVFILSGHHGQTLLRVPSALLGIISIALFATVVRSWHDRRTSVLAVILFATSSWILHISRLAGNDIVYLLAVPLLMLGYLLRQRHPKSTVVFYGSALAWSLLLFIPGLVWLVALSVAISWPDLGDCWHEQRGWWRRLLFVGAGLSWVPLLVPDFLRSSSDLRLWLGLPAKFPTLAAVGKQLVAVPVHLLIRGPAYPEVWLGRLPLLDLATLAFVIIGACFYCRHWRARRARQLALLLVAGTFLVGLGGPVGLTLLVPVLYLVAASGLHSLLQSWLRVFPSNYIARNVGISLIVIAVAVSASYNLRSYFIAWPRNATTQATFRYRL